MKKELTKITNGALLLVGTKAKDQQDKKNCFEEAIKPYFFSGRYHEVHLSKIK